MHISAFGGRADGSMCQVSDRPGGATILLLAYCQGTPRKVPREINSRPAPRKATVVTLRVARSRHANLSHLQLYEKVATSWSLLKSLNVKMTKRPSRKPNNFLMASSSRSGKKRDVSFASIPLVADSSGRHLLVKRRPLLALSGHHWSPFQCPLSGGRATWRLPCEMSAYDPKRTFQSNQLKP